MFSMIVSLICCVAVCQNVNELNLRESLRLSGRVRLLWTLDTVHLRGQTIYEMIWGGVSLCPCKVTPMLRTCKTITFPSSRPSVAQYEEGTHQHFRV